jgi:hypothetical protein
VSIARTLTLKKLCAIAGAVFLTLGGLLPAQSPEFIPGDPRQLECEVDLKASKRLKGLFAVRVSNRSKTSAVPCVFRVVMDLNEAQAEGRIRLFFAHRTGFPYHGRSGRALPPGGSENYLLPAYWGDKTPLSKMRISVQHASFYAGTTKSSCPVVIAKQEEVELYDDYDKRKYKAWRTTLRNRSDRPVSLVLRTVGKGYSGLQGAFIGPKATLVSGSDASLTERTWHQRAPGLNFGDSEVKKIEIIEWSEIHEVGALQARRVFEDAWRERWHYPNDGRSYRGQVRVKVGAKTEPLAFTLEPAGRLSVDGPNPFAGTVGSHVLAALENMFRPLCGPRADTICKHGDFSFIERDAARGDLIRVTNGDESLKDWKSGIFRIHEMRILERRDTLNLLPSRLELRELETAPDGRHRPVRMRAESRLNERSPSHQGSFAWTKWSTEGPQTFEARIPEFWGSVAQTTVRIEMMKALAPLASDKAPNTPESAAPPRGAGVASLRRAWALPYRYPGDAFDLRGSLELRAGPSSSMDWWGHERLKGKIALLAWRGRRSGTNRPQSSIAFTTKAALSADGASAIEDLLAARSSIYTRQDFAARASFDETFAGCTIEAPKRRVLVVQGHSRITAVKLGTTLVEEIRYRDQTVNRYRFSRSREGFVPKRTEMIFGDRKAVIDTKYSSLRPGLLVPSQIKIKDWFSADWGPETFRYRFRSATRSR